MPSTRSNQSGVNETPIRSKPPLPSSHFKDEGYYSEEKIDVKIEPDIEPKIEPGTPVTPTPLPTQDKGKKRKSPEHRPELPVERRLFADASADEKSRDANSSGRSFARQRAPSPEETYISTDPYDFWNPRRVKKIKQEDDDEQAADEIRRHETNNDHESLRSDDSQVSRSLTAQPNSASAIATPPPQPVTPSPVTNNAAPPTTPTTPSPSQRAGTSRFPFRTPPICKHCKSPGTRITVNGHDWYPQGRAKYVCREPDVCKKAKNAKGTPGELFLCWDDDLGTHDGVMSCFCKLPLRWDRIATPNGQQGAEGVGLGFWSCQLGRVYGACGYYSLDRKACGGSPKDARKWKPSSFNNVEQAG